MTIEAAQKEVDNWIKMHGVRYFSELTNMALLTEEVGEVARIIARTYGEQSTKKTEQNADLKDELADLTEALKNNLAKKTQRDSERHKSNKKLL